MKLKFIKFDLKFIVGMKESGPEFQKCLMT